MSEPLLSCLTMIVSECRHDNGDKTVQRVDSANVIRSEVYVKSNK